MSPYIWDYRGRVLISVLCLVISKLAMVGVPVVLKHIVDGLNAGVAAGGQHAVALPVLLLLIYGLLRFINSGFNELRDAIFARVRYKVLENNRRDQLDAHEFDGEQVVWMDRSGEVNNPRTGAPRGDGRA